MRIKKVLAVAAMISSPLSFSLVTLATTKIILIVLAFAPPLGLLIPFAAPFFDELLGVLLVLGGAALINQGGQANLILG